MSIMVAIQADTFGFPHCKFVSAIPLGEELYWLGTESHFTSVSALKEILVQTEP